MHLQPAACFRLVGVSLFKRCGIPRVSCLLKNDLFLMKNNVYGSGLLFSKPLYVVSKLQSYASPELKPLDPVSECEPHIVMRKYNRPENSLIVVKSENNFPLVHISEVNNICCTQLYECSEAKDIVKLSDLTTAINSLPHEHGLAALGLHKPSSVSFESCMELMLLPATSNENMSSDHSGTKSNAVEEDMSNRPSEEQLLVVGNRVCHCIMTFFKKSMDFSYYHKRIEFHNNFQRVVTVGLASYIQQMYLLKFYGHINYINRVKTEVLKVTHHVEDGTVRVRWRASGIPLMNVLLHCVQLKNKSFKTFLEEESEWIDGFSVFSVDSNGLVFKHVCDKMIPDEEPLSGKSVSLKTRIMSLLGATPRPVSGMHAMITCVAFANSDRFKILKTKKIATSES